jgi:hypothetical protein
MAYSAVSSAFLHVLLAISVVVLVFLLRKLLQFLDILIEELLKIEDLIKVFQRPILYVPTDIELTLAEEAFRVQQTINQEIAEHREEYETDSYRVDPDDKATIFELNNGKIFKSTVDEYANFVLSIINAQKTNDDETQE